MSSRDYIRSVVSANTSLYGQRVGDEVFDPTSNRLFKTLPIGGTTVTNSEVLLNGPALAATTLSVGGINANNTTVTNTLTVNNNLRVNNTISFSNSTTRNTATILYNASLNSVDFYFD
jgi:hypothetical protein